MNNELEKQLRKEAEAYANTPMMVNSDEKVWRIYDQPYPDTVEGAWLRGAKRGYELSESESQPTVKEVFTREQVIDFLKWIRDEDYKPFVTNKGELRAWLKGGMSISTPDSYLLDKYLSSQLKSNS